MIKTVAIVMCMLYLINCNFTLDSYRKQLKEINFKEKKKGNGCKQFGSSIFELFNKKNLKEKRKGILLSQFDSIISVVLRSGNFNLEDAIGKTQDEGEKFILDLVKNFDFNAFYNLKDNQKNQKDSKERKTQPSDKKFNNQKLFPIIKSSEYHKRQLLLNIIKLLKYEAMFFFNIENKSQLKKQLSKTNCKEIERLTLNLKKVFEELENSNITKNKIQTQKKKNILSDSNSDFFLIIANCVYFSQNLTKLVDNFIKDKSLWKFNFSLSNRYKETKKLVEYLNHQILHEILRQIQKRYVYAYLVERKEVEQNALYYLMDKNIVGYSDNEGLYLFEIVNNFIIEKKFQIPTVKLLEDLYLRDIDESYKNNFLEKFKADEFLVKSTEFRNCSESLIRVIIKYKQKQKVKTMPNINQPRENFLEWYDKEPAYLYIVYKKICKSVSQWVKRARGCCSRHTAHEQMEKYENIIV